MSDAAIEMWLKKYEGVHAQEIGLRVGQAREVLEELYLLRMKARELAYDETKLPFPGIFSFLIAQD